MKAIFWNIGAALLVGAGFAAFDGCARFEDVGFAVAVFAAVTFFAGGDFAGRGVALPAAPGFDFAGAAGAFVDFAGAAEARFIFPRAAAFFAGFFFATVSFAFDGLALLLGLFLAPCADAPSSFFVGMSPHIIGRITTAQRSRKFPIHSVEAP